MRTPVADIISDAYRELNVTALGSAPTPAQLAEGLTRLNRIIKASLGFEVGELLRDWLAPAPQRTANVAANYPQLPYPLNFDNTVLPFPMSSANDIYVYPYPPKNSRIVWGGNTLTVWFPEAPDNGSRMMLVQGSGAGDMGEIGNVLTLDGNGRYIGEAGTTTATFTFNPDAPFDDEAWIYMSELGVWVPIATLQASDAMPFSSKWDDYWTALLAVRLAPRYNKTPSAETKGTVLTGAMKIDAEFAQTGVTVYGSYDIPRSLQSFISGRWNY